MDISIIVPAYNEKQSVRPLYEGLKKMIVENEGLISKYEIIFVDDGSTDGTLDELFSIEDECFSVISLPQNSGKSAALANGFMLASYEVIVTIDSDLQDDPFDIPGMLFKLNEGYDCVCGWRHKKGSGIVKSVCSVTANYVRSKVLKDGIRDSSSPLKVIKKAATENMFFFNGFHRFIPFLVIVQGLKVCEVQVVQYPRRYGESKYDNFGRLLKTVCDLVAMVWLKKNMIRIIRK